MNDTSKIIQALCYIANSQADATVDTMKAYKLLWLADRWHLRNGGRTITGDEYWALPYGPVPSDAKNLVDGNKTKKGNPEGVFEEYIEVLPDHKIRAKRPTDMDEFSDSDIDAMNKILSYFKDWSAVELSNYSHTFPEWKTYEKLLNDNSKKNGYRINKDLFFLNMEEESGFFVDAQQKMDAAKEYFHLFQLS